ncbi:MAG: bifunctional riboflavin kinase/FAD synthetase [bacterium]|nr:bifunctional riboflavin kinase/FAD synthetase [bacterium]
MRMMLNPVRTGPCVLVLGMFDGVHRGHQALLMKGRALSAACRLPLNVCTFEPHPLKVLCPAMTPPRLTTQTERAQLMASFGVDNLCVHTFNHALAAQPPEDFVRDMARIYQPRYVVSGFNFTFGDRGRGNTDTLRALQGEYGYEAVTVSEVVLEGKTVSSTRIRALLRAGELAQATRLLGHAYTMAGRVVNGKHIGRTLGFPTANLQVSEGKAMPAYGVYTCYLTVKGDSFPAVVNVGRHPTLPEGAVTVEAHVLSGGDFPLYGERVRLTFMSFRRAETTFDSVDALRAQIARDVADAKAYFASVQTL